MWSVVELKVTAVVFMKITVFRGATTCSLVELVHILEKVATSIFIVQEFYILVSPTNLLLCVKVISKSSISWTGQEIFCIL
jgi:hypothetical protein